MNQLRSITTLFTLALSLVSQAQIKVDLLVYNAKIYTVDASFSIAEAMAIQSGKIIELGKTQYIMKKYSGVQKIDAKNKFIYPGFIDAHAHFYRYGLGLQTANLVGTDSWEEVIEKLKTFSKELNNKIVRN